MQALEIFLYVTKASTDTSINIVRDYSCGTGHYTNIITITSPSCDLEARINKHNTCPLLKCQGCMFQPKYYQRHH